MLVKWTFPHKVISLFYLGKSTPWCEGTGNAGQKKQHGELLFSEWIWYRTFGANCNLLQLCCKYISSKLFKYTTNDKLSNQFYCIHLESVSITATFGTAKYLKLFRILHGPILPAIFYLLDTICMFYCKVIPKAKEKSTLIDFDTWAFLPKVKRGRKSFSFPFLLMQILINTYNFIICLYKYYLLKIITYHCQFTQHCTFILYIHSPCPLKSLSQILGPI